MNPEELHQFHIKESHMAEGISADFIWYEASVIREALKHAFSVNMHRFDKVVSVMEARHKEHIKMLQDVMDENRALKARIKDDTISIVANVGTKNDPK
jgi:hypothetical protein